MGQVFAVLGLNGNEHDGILLLLRFLIFYFAGSPAEWAFVLVKEFFSFAVGTKEHPTCLAMLPVSSAEVTLWTDSHSYSSFTALAVYIFVNRLC
jgi:hypothetical protein